MNTYKKVRFSKIFMVIFAVLAVFIFASCSNVQRTDDGKRAETSGETYGNSEKSSASSADGASAEGIEYRELTAEERAVIIEKGTELPFTGEYTDLFEQGVYVCRQCGSPLYLSDDKFHSGCGWPSFDDKIPGAVTRIQDADGIRTEIVCSVCGGHLGHVFTGEGYTEKNVRHCVNSISLDFYSTEAVTEASSKEKEMPEPVSETAIFAGGCFWGVEYMFEELDGVLNAVSGYTGGSVDNPSYQQVQSHTTGHVEAVKISYDPSRISYRELAEYFFEIHDPTQANGQGPDIGEQYLSVLFYADEHQKAVGMELIGILKQRGYDVVTEISPAEEFWEVEDYHQDYYENKGTQPYCHRYVPRFGNTE